MVVLEQLVSVSSLDHLDFYDQMDEQMTTEVLDNLDSNFRRLDETIAYMDHVAAPSF